MEKQLKLIRRYLAGIRLCNFIQRLSLYRALDGGRSAGVAVDGSATWTDNDVSLVFGQRTCNQRLTAKFDRMSIAKNSL